MLRGNTWQGGAASNTLVACSAVGTGLLLAALGLDLKRENYHRLAGAERCFSFGILSLYFKAAIALRRRRMTPMRAAIMDRKRASMTTAGMEPSWEGGLADDIDLGAAVTVFCVGVTGMARRFE